MRQINFNEVIEDVEAELGELDNDNRRNLNYWFGQGIDNETFYKILDRAKEKDDPIPYFFGALRNERNQREKDEDEENYERRVE
jgi:protein involved in sex pheromone biosynthesis